MDADYCFTFADVGCQGRISDGGVFRNCTLYKKLGETNFNISDNQPLPRKEIPMPYVFVADDAFGLNS